MPAVGLFAAWTVAVTFQSLAWRRILRSRPWEWAAVLLALVLAGTHQIFFSTLAEDAFITYRYAEQLAAGNGPVFNVGERVEGYSNFLFMVILAVPLILADTDVVLVARLLGAACNLVALVLLHLLVRRITTSAGAGVLAVTITAAVGSFAAYGPSGMETPLFVALVVASLLAVVSGRPIVGGIAIALATMTRPDGIVIAAVLVVWMVLTPAGGGSRWRAPAVFLTGAAALGVPWTAWRIAYYGYFLPNPIAAKSGLDLGWQMESGWNYLIGFVVATQALLIVVPLTAYLAVRRRGAIDTRRREEILLLLAAAVVYATFVVVSGGDWMPAWRFLVPVVPLTAAAAVATMWLARPALSSSEAASGRSAPALMAVMTLLLLATSVTDPQMRPAIDEWRRQVVELAEIGAWLERTLPDGTVVSTFANGALSHRAGVGLVVVDQLGLTDEHIARRGNRLSRGVVGHGAYDYRYIVEERRPEVVVTTGGGFQRQPSCGVPEPWRGAYESRVFRVSGQQLWVTLLLRTDLESDLAQRLGRDVGYDLATCPVPVPAT